MGQNHPLTMAVVLSQGWKPFHSLNCCGDIGAGSPVQCGMKSADSRPTVFEQVVTGMDNGSSLQFDGGVVESLAHHWNMQTEGAGK